jgi:F-type H+-transporting ATPase subunit gamma
VPSLKDIRRRITSVRKTQQITRAMRMVAGAKLRRAQQAIEAARPYADRMQATLAEVARSQKDAEHPLLAARTEVTRVEFLVVTSDRGLCGAFNANVLKHADPLIAQRRSRGQQVTVSTAGRKAREHYRRRLPGQLGSDHPQVGWVRYGQAADIAARLSSRYASGEIDEVILVYSQFGSAMTQRPRHVQLLPFAPADAGAAAEALPYQIEPSAEKLLAVLVPKAVEVGIYRALLETRPASTARG